MACAPHNVTSGCSNWSRPIRIQPQYGDTSALLKAWFSHAAKSISILSVIARIRRERDF